MTDANVLYQYVIYKHPGDYPDKFVVRRWRIGPAGELDAEIDPTAVADSIEEAREAVPTGFVNIGRQLGDDWAIYEVWT